MTILEIMVVLAVVVGLVFIARSGFRLLTKADLVENSTELSAVLRRTGQLAIEKGEMHRVLIDLDTQIYSVEVCQGASAIMRNELAKGDDDATKRAIERGKSRLNGLPTDSFAAGDPDEAAKKLTALAGAHIGDRTCGPAEGFSGDASGKALIRHLSADKGIKFKEVWVQHRDEGMTKGQIAIYFFPMGSSEKTVIEVTDGSETFSVLVYGLTGRVELRDGVLADVDNHMMRNVMGDRDKKREDER